MTNVVINVPTAHIDSTGVGFMLYGNHYRDAALTWLPRAKNSGQFDPVSYQLLCQSLELHLKSFIWLIERIDRDCIRKKYGHDLGKLWRHSKARGIDLYVRATPLRDLIVGLVGPYYKKRQFSYLDLDMIFSGFAISRRSHGPYQRCRVSRDNLRCRWNSQYWLRANAQTNGA